MPNKNKSLIDRKLEEFEEAVSKNYRGQDPYWPDWDAIKSFLRQALQEAQQEERDKVGREMYKIAYKKAQAEVVERMEELFKPKETGETRAHGGIVDYEIRITKKGWEDFKNLFLKALKEK